MHFGPWADPIRFHYYLSAGLFIFRDFLIFGSFPEIKVWETPEFKGDVALFSRTTPCEKWSNFDGQRDGEKVAGFHF
jgi:hypothetical protein